MKKYAGIILVLAMLLTLAACGHTHTPGDWEVDGAEHWKMCECGEKCEAGAHILDDMGFCTGCGAEVTDWGDSVDVMLRDEHDNLVRYLSFDADGNPVSDQRMDYTYDEAGNVTCEMHYDGGVLVEEYAYEDGVLSTLFTYNEDGTHQISLYDPAGNLISAVDYDAERQMTTGNYSEYAQDAEDNWYEVRNTFVDTDGSKYVGEYNAYEDQILWITYDPEGNVEHHERYEITYTDDGKKDTVKTYSHDVLVEEKIYTLVTYDDGWMNYPGTIIEYHEDGTKTVTAYDENDEIISQQSYDADGNVME